jgi:hypothetical protein
MPTAKQIDVRSAIAQFDAQMRLDPPHELAATPARAAEREPQMASVAVATAGSVAEASASEQLQLQADQLAGYLHIRLREVDRREATLNAHLAEQENGERSARLWFRERQQELDDRTAEFERREQELATRESVQVQAERELAESRRLSAFEVRRQTDALNARLRELELREQTVINDEAENAAVGANLAQRAAEQQQAEDRFQVETEQFHRQIGSLLTLIESFLHGTAAINANSLTPAGSAELAAGLSQREREVEETVVPPRSSEPAAAEALIERFAATINALHARQRNLDDAEALLADSLAELDAARRQMGSDRAAWDRCRDDQRAALDRARADAELELQRQGQMLVAREEERSQLLARQFDQRQAELTEQAARNDAAAADLERRQVDLERERLQIENNRRAYEREIRRLLGEQRR